MISRRNYFPGLYVSQAFHCKKFGCGGRAIAQAASRWLPTATTRALVRSGHVGFVADKVALGQVFSEYFGFPCKSSFYQVLHPHNHPWQVQ
jgi:hypothetical protein